MSVLELRLDLVRASQAVAALRPADSLALRTAGLDGDVVRITLAASSAHTPVARLRLEATAGADGVEYEPGLEYARERGAWVVPLADGPTTVEIGAIDPH